ncbi:hypothetical protein G0Q06_05810 [Puniceicoccales bacterium CK1056]|uniref:Uncharacterized protein n=1 Tax=Oceanipulchritudo coccoides TaxID=2706888 RepID=A0A6B2M2L9_9BACT|nr:hypothetical protein [Oceanipulchritudo coccoides]NDV61960.1 hypothetical protein [Oceanipulchritudo coccoides]
MSRLSLWSLTLATLASASPVFAIESADSEGTPPPVLEQPLYLNVPRDLWHLSTSWDVGKIRLRIGPEGKVVDWVPLELPHFKLVETIDKALKHARFTKPLVDGEPATIDMAATIPLRDVIGSIVLSVNIAEHIESRMAMYMSDQFKLVVSQHSELDEPVRLISTGEAFSVKDDNGVPLSGTVKVDLYVDPDGFPRMMVPDETANPYLAQAAIMTIANMRFTPPRRNGHPTVTKVRLPVVVGN